ncbi:hypothetical protein AGMMS49983_14940 [Clostridia bacterium]|nr:hypothetical protein AGMMS49983_14940 [Clostridia bacterium]
MKEDIFEKFIEESGIAVPKDRVDAAYDQLALEITHASHYESMMSGTILMPDDMPFSVEDIRETARKQVKTELVLEEVIRKENFEVTAEELEAEAKAMAERQQTTVEDVKRFFGEDLSLLKKDILLRKAIGFITGI